MTLHICFENNFTTFILRTQMHRNEVKVDFVNW